MIFLTAKAAEELISLNLPPYSQFPLIWRDKGNGGTC